MRKQIILDNTSPLQAILQLLVFSFWFLVAEDIEIAD
jgi:hypothetical protein